MKIRVFGVVASPRRGNTYDLCKRFIDKLSRYLDLDVELRLLKEFRVEPCTGCSKCIFEGRCWIRDDIETILSKMLEADLLIFASPVYVCNVSYLFKVFMDRTAWLNHYPLLIGKKSVVIATTASSCLDQALRILRMYAVSAGTTCIAEIGAAYRNGRPLHEQALDRELERVAKRIYRALAGTEIPKPKLLDVVLFNAFKHRARVAAYWNPNEYRYWKERGLLKRSYYDDKVEIPLLTKVLASVLTKIVGKRFTKPIVVEL